jgi:hypothetical protein
MWCFNRILPVRTLALASALITAENALAQLAVLQTNSPATKLELRAGETIGDTQVRRAFLTVGTNQFVFRVPTGFKLDASQHEKLIASDSAGSFVTLRILPNMPSSDGTQAWQELARKQFPESTITAEFSEFALNRSGPAFDISWLAAGARHSARVVFIPSSAGLLEITLLTPPDRFASGETALKIVLSSLQSDEHGKIVIVPLPSYS